MPIALIVLSVLLAVLMSGAAVAGPHSSGCASPAGKYIFDRDPEHERHDLYAGTRRLEYKLVRRITLIKQEGLCTTKAGKEYAWELHRYVSEIETEIDGKKTALTFLCLEAHSGVPAGAPDCTRTITKSKRLKPAYTETSR